MAARPIDRLLNVVTFRGPDGGFDRRAFLKFFAVVAVVPFVRIFYSMIVYRQRFLSGKKDLAVPADVPDGTSFYDDAIIHKEGDSLTVLSSKCSHLGCNISKKSGEDLVCSCHGSMYRKDGTVIRGPATRDLKKLEYAVDEKNKKIIITL